MAPARDCETRVCEYLAGGDDSGFGGDDPWEQVDGGVAAIAIELATVSTTLADFPTDADTPLNAMKLGSLVGRCSSLTPMMCVVIETYMTIARNAQLPRYKQGVAMGKDNLM